MSEPSAEASVLTSSPETESDHGMLAALVAALENPDVAVRLTAARNLQQAGAAAVPVLLDSLREAEGEGRLALIRTLGMLGKAARPALGVLAQFAEDPELAEAAAWSARNIRHGPPLAWERIFTRLGAWFLVVGLILEAGCVLLHWGGLFSQVRGISLEIALAWAMIGAFLGAAVGAGLHGRLGVYVGVNYLGMAGAALGACLAEVLVVVLEPLLGALK